MHSWHLRATVLPHGRHPIDAWVGHGVISEQPIAGASTLPGRFVLAGGLVDAHVHLTMNFGRALPHADGSDALMGANADRHRHAGILALRDAGAAWGGVPHELDEGPRLQRASRLLAPAGRGYPNVCRSVEAGDLVAVAMAEVEAGADWVKVLADFPGADGNWFTAPANYPRAVISELVQQAHTSGARVMAHSTGLAAADLLAAGVDSIEHGMAVTREQVEAMADQQIAWTATLATADKHVGALAAAPTPVGAYLRSQFDRLRELFPLAVSRGVPVIAGTDEIGPGALWRELQCLVDSGLTREQALAAGSTVARTWLGFPAVAPGQLADLVTWDDDPRDDLARLATPAAVLYGGKLVSQVRNAG